MFNPTKTFLPHPIKTFRPHPIKTFLPHPIKTALSLFIRAKQGISLLQKLASSEPEASTCSSKIA